MSFDERGKFVKSLWNGQIKKSSIAVITMGIFFSSCVGISEFAFADQNLQGTQRPQVPREPLKSERGSSDETAFVLLSAGAESFVIESPRKLAPGGKFLTGSREVLGKKEVQGKSKADPLMDLAERAEVLRESRRDVEIKPERFPIHLLPSEMGTGIGTGVGTGAGGMGVGTGVGTGVGAAAGSPVGSPVGTPVGSPVGTPVGMPVGSPVGTPVGMPVGTPTGSPVGSPGSHVGVGAGGTGIVPTGAGGTGVVPPGSGGGWVDPLDPLTDPGGTGVVPTGTGGVPYPPEGPEEGIGVLPLGKIDLPPLEEPRDPSVTPPDPKKKPVKVSRGPGIGGPGHGDYIYIDYPDGTRVAVPIDENGNPTGGGIALVPKPGAPANGGQARHTPVKVKLRKEPPPPTIIIEYPDGTIVEQPIGRNGKPRGRPRVVTQPQTAPPGVKKLISETDTLKKQQIGMMGTTKGYFESSAAGPNAKNLQVVTEMTKTEDKEAAPPEEE